MLLVAKPRWVENRFAWSGDNGMYCSQELGWTRHGMMGGARAGSDWFW